MSLSRRRFTRPFLTLSLFALLALCSQSAWAQNPPLLPDAQMTPGATLPVTKDDLCVPGYAKKVRNVPSDVKSQVYAEYGIASHRPGEYEVDHLISLELGGSNSIKNLWPQSYLTQPWNAHVKDALENELHRQVCNGTIDLATAQHDIATDWIAAYKKYFHVQMPLARIHGAGKTPRATRKRGVHLRLPFGLPQAAPANQTVEPSAPQPGGASGQAQVWVNTKSGKYFLPGARYYGKTKQGAYMTESQAKAQGYVAAQGR